MNRKKILGNGDDDAAVHSPGLATSVGRDTDDIVTLS